jgi:hypothetical protein
MSGLTRRTVYRVRMEMMRVLVLVLTAAIVGCDGKPARTPTQPSAATPPSNAPVFNPPTSPVRTITLKPTDGRTDLDFGDVEPGGDAAKMFEVCNDGNSALHVSRIEGSAGYSASAYQEWYSGPDGDPNALFNVSPGHCWEAWSTFLPTTSGPPGCYWERLRHVQGTPEAIAASGSIASGGNVTVDIQAGDAGFHTNAACGQWTREK